jgi:hypothetical protein
MLNAAVGTVAYGGRRRDVTLGLGISHRHCRSRTSDRVDFAPLLYDSSFCEPSGLSARPQQLPIELLWKQVWNSNRIPNLDASQIHPSNSIFPLE